jgi:hemophore-related protein
MKMVKLSSIGLVVALGGLALSLTAGAGVASADPAVDTVVNTTCSYSQAMAALKAQSPEAAAQVAAAPAAQSWLQTFLASPADQRRLMVQQVQAIEGAQGYVGLVLEVANTCGNY